MSSCNNTPYTLFISDLHLEEDDTATTQQFLQFLEEDTKGAEALYILGDFFEQWIGDDAMTPYHHKITNALATLSQQNIPVYFMHGNRDFLIRNRFATLANCTIIPDPYILDLYGRHILLKHGDDLCTDDKRHQRFRQFVNNKLVQKIYLSSPIRFRAWFANKLRNSSKMQKSKIAQHIMDVNQQTVETTMTTYNLKLLIHGHTHRPHIHELTINNQVAQRIVLGDWHHRRHMLKIHSDGEIQFIEKLRC